MLAALFSSYFTYLILGKHDLRQWNRGVPFGFHWEREQRALTAEPGSTEWAQQLLRNHAQRNGMDPSLQENMNWDVVDDITDAPYLLTGVRHIADFVHTDPVCYLHNVHFKETSSIS